MKQYTRKQITEAIAYWQKQLKLGNCKKINEWDDTHLPKGRVKHHETGKPKRYWVAVDEFSDNLNIYSFFVDSSLNRRTIANNVQPLFTSQDFTKAVDIAKRAVAKWPNWYVFIGVDDSSRGMMTQKNHLRSAVVDIWSPKLKFWERGTVYEAQETTSKRYTKKQITEAIAYWEKQLKVGNYKKVD